MIFSTHERLWARVEVTGFCWLWTGPLEHGYGRIKIDGRMQLVHRVAYELLVGDLGDQELDHLCRIRNCVNPDHLQPATHRDNVLRSPTHFTAVHARKTHCIHGHAFTPENTYHRPSRPSRRECLTCKEARRCKSPVTDVGTHSTNAPSTK